MLIVFERPTTNRQQARFWDRECNGDFTTVTLHHLLAERSALQFGWM